MATFTAPIEFAEKLGSKLPTDAAKTLLATYAGITGVTTTALNNDAWSVSGSGREVRVPVGAWLVKLVGIESPVVVPDSLYAAYAS
ncbi:hypothetical protein ACFO1B_39670 [Dactylosporangium siamense]|uniref:Uncharacterized protein n=1 Tax=Dactylosporangium siamense TaxID=685454 RepID=A0A919PWJ4_9ACTN|nr:hypothetical protein [Dactylosporangium siamense]GIG49913.1 hypothetical protein Dsi01nite_079540 [Dactylosporangium siamense]